MTHQEVQALKKLFVATALYYGHEIPDQALSLYVADLEDLPFDEISRAMHEIRRDPKTTRCPIPAQIRARSQSGSDPLSQAQIIAGRILESISRVGPYRTDEAREQIGPIGWRVVELSGGWSVVCDIQTDDIGTHRAQWNRIAHALLLNPNADHRESKILSAPEELRSLAAASLKAIPS